MACLILAIKYDTPLRVVQEVLSKEFGVFTALRRRKDAVAVTTVDDEVVSSTGRDDIKKKL